MKRVVQRVDVNGDAIGVAAPFVGWVVRLLAIEADGDVLFGIYVRTVVFPRRNLVDGEADFIELLE
jgi:hypothetical protein